MARDAVQIKLQLENQQLSKQLADTERKFARLENSAKKSASGMSSSFNSAFSNISSNASSLATSFGPAGIAIGAATTAMAALGVATIAVAKAVSDLDDQAIALGISFQGIQELQYIAVQSGVGVDSLTQALGKLETVLSEGATEKNVAALSKLGITFEQIASLAPDEQLLLVAERMAELKTQAEFANVGMDLFGKSWRTVGPLLKTGEEGIKDAKDEMKRLGIVIDDTTKDKMKKLDDFVEGLTISFRALKANALAPVADWMNTTLRVILSDTVTGFEKLYAVVNQFNLGGAIGDLLTKPAELRTATSATDSYKKKKQEAVDRANASAKAINDAENAAFLKMIQNQQANEKKSSEIRAKASESAISQATSEAQRAAEQARKDAELIAQSFQEGLTSSKQNTSDAQAKNAALGTGGLDALEALEKQLELRDKIAKATADQTDPEKIKQLEAQITLEFEANEALEARIELYARMEDLSQKSDADQKQRREDAKQADIEYAKQTEQMWVNVASIAGDAFINVASGAQTASEAIRGLIELLLKAVIQAAILTAINGGSFGSNFGAQFGGPAPKSSPQVNVFNYGNQAGGIQTRGNASGGVDIMIGQIANAINSGGNGLDQALRRSYGLGRVGV